MQYMRFSVAQREELLNSLFCMKAFLHESFASLTREEALLPGPNGSFSPVEQVWHLADLELDGFTFRIKTLESEMDPELPDFDGDAVARERNYKSLSIADGLKAFEKARDTNIALLRALPAESWTKSGTQHGVGAVSLCDMPIFIQQHDMAHRAEISAWIKLHGHHENI